MTYEQAVECAKWQRVTHPAMQAGCYVAYDVATARLRRLWPNGDGCDFRPSDDELTRTDWATLEEGWG